MSAVNWKDLVKQAPCELVLSGDQISEEVKKDDGKLNELIYSMRSLNFLDITDTLSLTTISQKISNLSNLTNLVLRGNKITEIPAEIGNLKKLKCLDLSRNNLTELPSNLFDNLVNLQIINLEQNQLESLPTMNKLENLISLKFGSNKVKDFPSSLCNGIYKKPESDQSTIAICGGGAVHLTELFASHNLIEAIPYRISRLVALKNLDLSFNKLVEIPSELSECGKLKDLNLKENPLKDRRLYKMIEQCPSKKVIEHIRNNCKSGKGQAKGKDDDDDESESEEEEEKNKIIVVKHHKQTFVVKASKQIQTQRKIVACILKDVDLTNIKVLKKFIQIQTKLHQGSCDNRQKATIATHDLAKLLPPPITFASKLGEKKPEVPVSEEPPKREAIFDGRVPTKISLVPLGRAQEMTAMAYYRLLNDEADQHRKEKKRSTISGIHKYLHLLKGKQQYPVLLDYNQTHALSLPPLTNSEYSRINSNTKDVFVEVTGISIPVCREVMNEFIRNIIDLDVKDDESDEVVHMVDLDDGKQTLYIEPVVVHGLEDEQLIVKFPAKIDLQFDDVNMIIEN